MTRRPTTRGDERGLAGIEGLAFGVLIFVFGTLLVTNAWGVIDAKLTTATAAREAARAYVEAPSLADAQHVATVAAESAMEGQHHRLTDLSIDHVGNSEYERCGAIVVEAKTEVPRISLPLLRGSGGTYTVSARHGEVIDPYRSGLGGTAGCAAP